LGIWVRLHYVYPYPSVDEVIPMMAEGKILPYLDIPFQHAHPDVLKRMARPAAAARTLDEIAAWRAIAPDLTLRSTFIVGFPGETARVQISGWTKATQLDRRRAAGMKCQGRAVGSLPACRQSTGPLGPVHAKAQAISRRLAAKSAQGSGDRGFGRWRRRPADKTDAPELTEH
jgi:ribosomal protein S12 methylthiotransferase